MNMNKNIIESQQDRLTALGRKGSQNLVAGDVVTRDNGDSYTFIRWSGASVPGRQASYRMAFVRTTENKVTTAKFNMAGSVKVS